MIDAKILQNIGLSKIESKIYIFLLENGVHHISDIAKYTDSNRVQVYGALPRLIEKNSFEKVINEKGKSFLQKILKISRIFFMNKN
ncbi:helix-turn-helix domain-containing protein [Candidatus Gracilibacteria bacterium]|nr:helix-turn-helix domain-containing protein [Candidatus Gracilibacteria bacterium]